MMCGRQILTCCVHSPSVAEIAAHLSLPLGATRFLVGDLVTQGYLRVHATPGDSMTISERRELLTRTLTGLQRSEGWAPPCDLVPGAAEFWPCASISAPIMADTNSSRPSSNI